MARPIFDVDSWMFRKKKEKKQTHTASCSRRFRDMAIPGGGSSHYGVQRNLRMHACICRDCRGWASLSLSTRSPKVCSPLDKEAPSFSLSLSVTTKGAEIQNLHCLCLQRNNDLKPRFFFPFDIGHSSSTMGLSWSSLLALVEDITPPSLPSILLSITQVLLNIV